MCMKRVLHIAGCSGVVVVTVSEDHVGTDAKARQFAFCDLLDIPE